jgi:outer membrane protein OmpA-like peptidoglycan-associated protein
MDLSYERARSVAGALMESGVAADRIRLTAWGDAKPLVTAEERRTPAGANRRAEIIVHATTSVRVTDIADKGRLGNG